MSHFVSRRRCELAELLDVADRGVAEVAFVLAAEVGGVVVADAVAGFGGVEVFAEHQPAGFLQAQVLPELHGLIAGSAA